MTGKRDVERRMEAREVTLRVDGVEVDLNGYVKDVFQETVLALVRTLGTEDPDRTIEVSIGPRRQ